MAIAIDIGSQGRVDAILVVFEWVRAQAETSVQELLPLWKPYRSATTWIRPA